ncbi:DUF6090 family protein [Ekhidna sp.]
MMKKNKLTTYLLNIVGEILLVVIGILIAVQIDHQIEAGKEREREEFLKSEINREMKLNLERFELSQKSIQGVVDAGNELVEIFPLSASKLKSEKFKIFPDFLLNPSYDPSNGVINSIINSGEINLLRDEELRQLIVTWNDAYNDYKEEEFMAWTNGYKLMDWLSENFPNPRYVKPEYDAIDYRILQSKIGKKVDMYIYTVEGEDCLKLKSHIVRMIELTE